MFVVIHYCGLVMFFHTIQWAMYTRNLLFIGLALAEHLNLLILQVSLPSEPPPQ